MSRHFGGHHTTRAPGNTVPTGIKPQAPVERLPIRTGWRFIDVGENLKASMWAQP